MCLPAGLRSQENEAQLLGKVSQLGKQLAAARQELACKEAQLEATGGALDEVRDVVMPPGMLGVLWVLKCSLAVLDTQLLPWLAGRSIACTHDSSIPAVR